jgi:hypothetical protein
VADAQQEAEDRQVDHGCDERRDPGGHAEPQGEVEDVIGFSSGSRLVWAARVGVFELVRGSSVLFTRWYQVLDACAAPNYESGMPLWDVQQLLGHGWASTTVGYLTTARGDPERHSLESSARAVRRLTTEG